MRMSRVGVSSICAFAIVAFIMTIASSYSSVAHQATIQSRVSTGTVVCLLGNNFYKTNPPSNLSAVSLFDLDPTTGAGTNSRLTGAPPLIGLAWAGDGRLYGVSILGGSGAGPGDAVYQIDPSTGATALVGPTGLHDLFEGDLATNPLTGEIFGISDRRLFRFPGLTATSHVPTAALVGQLNYPSPTILWDVSGLAFDATGRLYALTQQMGTTGPAAHLLRLNVSGSVVTVASDIVLSRRFKTIGGLEFVNGRLLYAEGEQPNLIGVSSPNNLYPLYEINPSTGVVTVRGLTNILGGVSSLVSCAPQIRACTPPPPDMDAWYPMDGNAHDLILGKNALPSGQVSYVGGVVSQALVLYGGYLTIPPGPVLNQGLGDFSIDTWILTLPGQTGTRAIVDRRIFTGSNIRGWSLFTYEGMLGLQLADGGASNYFDNRTLPVGWHHVAVTVDRDNPQGIRFYIDGIAGPPANPTARQGNLDNNSPTYIGRHALNGTPTPNLRLDELEFFDRTLAANEIAAIFNAGSYGKCKGSFQ